LWAAPLGGPPHLQPLQRARSLDRRIPLHPGSNPGRRYLARATRRLSLSNLMYTPSGAHRANAERSRNRGSREWRVLAQGTRPLHNSGTTTTASRTMQVGQLCNNHLLADFVMHVETLVLLLRNTRSAGRTEAHCPYGTISGPCPTSRLGAKSTGPRKAYRARVLTPGSLLAFQRNRSPNCRNTRISRSPRRAQILLANVPESTV